MLNSRRQNIKWTLIFSGILLGAVFLSLLTGPTDILLSDIINTIINLVTRTELSEGPQIILGEIRIPRIIAAGLCGAALAVAGCISQALFRNPLASPSITGTESGAALAAVIMFYSGTAFSSLYALPAAAMTGAALSTLVVFFLAKSKSWQNIETLLLAGFALNTLFGAGTSLVISLALEDHQKSAAMMHWLLGGFQARGWEHVAIGLIILTAGVVWSWILAPKLDVLALGEEHAATLGIKTRQLRTQSILAIGILAGGAVAVAGAIPFIGLIVPHVTRLLTGPHNRRLIVFSLLNGASLVMIADALARSLRSPSEMEVGIITALIGAPYFLWLLLKRQRGAL